MPSTYTTNLGIEKIATGEQSGTWGTTTNTNLDLVDQAIDGIVSITLTGTGTSGSPNDVDITNGSASDGRNKFIEFVDGADLGGTVYVRLTPNDAEKICHIRNSLSGSRNILLFQGTYDASNDIEIENGKDYVVKFDGGGSSATVTDVFNDLAVTAISASSADIDGGTIDGVVIGGTTPATKAVIDNITIDGGAIRTTSNNLIINAQTSGDVRLISDESITLASGSGTGEDITLDQLSIEDEGLTISTTVDSDLTINPSGTLSEVNISKNVSLPDDTFFKAGNSDDIAIGHASFYNNSTIDTEGNAIFHTASNLLISHGATGPFSGAETMGHFNGDGAVELYYDGSKKFETTSTGIDVTGKVLCDEFEVDGIFSLDTTSSGTAVNLETNNSSTTGSGPDIYLGRDGVSYAIANTPSGRLRFASRHEYAVSTHSTIEGFKDAGEISQYRGSLRFKNTDRASTTLIERMRMDENGIIINEDSDAGTDFRVESDGDSNAIFVDSSADTVFVGGNSIHFGAQVTDAKFCAKGSGSGSSEAIAVFQDLDTDVNGNVIAEFNFAADNSFTSTSYYATFTDSGGTQGSINGTGAGTVTYSTTSDERLKENITDTESKIDLVKSLKVRDYNWINSGVSQTGFIAQELHEQIPDAVSVGLEEEEGGFIPWGVDYGKITPHLTKALQEALAKIEELEARITDLESN